jgi:hypothetical protein
VRLGALVCLCSEARRAVASRSATSVASGGQSRVAGGVECESVCTVVNFFHSAAAQRRGAAALLCDHYNETSRSVVFHERSVTARMFSRKESLRLRRHRASERLAWRGPLVMAGHHTHDHTALPS